MLLAVDIGNSNIKFGIFDGEHLLTKSSVPTSSEISIDKLKSLIDGDVSITDAIICSVVPEKEESLREVLQTAFDVASVSVSNDLDFGLEITYEPLSAIGTDRLVNSFAAIETYGAPAIICSIGTATTFDVIDGDRRLLGGVIAPGMKTMAKALHLSTAKLPEVEIEIPKSLLGNTTVESIRSGIFYGHVAMIEGMIKTIKESLGNSAKVVATGGFASLIAENTTKINFVDDNLLLNGLRMLYNRISSGVSR
jgi:type III pantothenate kinase